MFLHRMKEGHGLDPSAQEQDLAVMLEQASVGRARTTRRHGEMVAGDDLF